MGDRKNEIITKACAAIYEKWNELLPAEKKEDLELYRNRIMELEVKTLSKSTTVKPQIEARVNTQIRSWIREYVSNDYKFLESLIGDTFFDDVEEKECNEFFSFLLHLRSIPLKHFYILDKDKDDTLRSINASIKSGKLRYSYEKFCDELLEVWYGKEYLTGSLFEIVKRETSFHIQAAEEAKQGLVNALESNSYIVVGEWRNFLEKLEVLYAKVLMLEQISEYKILSAVTCVDAISGIIRDVLTIFIRLSVLYNVSSPEEIVNTYIVVVNGFIENAACSENNRYPFFENYLIRISMLSLVGEREEWIFIQSFLLQEVLKEVTPKKTDRYKKEEKQKQVSKIIKWFTEERGMKLVAEEGLLLKATYDECFMYKKQPAKMKRHGIENFMNYIDSEEARLSPNMILDEMFFYQKILRGLAREANDLEWYKMKEQALIRIYEMEKKLFSDVKIANGYLGIWAKAMIYGIKETRMFIMQQYINKISKERDVD